MKRFKEFLKEDAYMRDDKEIDNTVHYPKGVYVSVSLSDISKQYIEEYCNKYLSSSKTEINYDLHCTIIYSKKEQKEEVKTKEYKYLANFSKFSKFGENKDVLVMELDCDMLIERNKELVDEYGFISDFEEYKPHITIAYKSDIDVNYLPPFDKIIELENEQVEELDEDWASDKKEEDSISDLIKKYREGQDGE
jgi:2'-5' RNA ligase